MDLNYDAKHLPSEIKQKIINYTNVITYRNGKYINKISPTDSRYEILRKLPKKIIFKNNKVLLNLINFSPSHTCGYLIEYSYENYIMVNIKFIVKTTIFNTKTETNFINKEDKWVKIVNYSM